MIKKSIFLSLAVFIICLLTITPAENAEINAQAAVEAQVGITATPSFGSAPLTVSFDASEFLYHYGDKLSFSWDFNDGGKSDGVTTTHTFSTRGTYTVALSVTTPFGPQDAWVVIVVN